MTAYKAITIRQSNGKIREVISRIGVAKALIGDQSASEIPRTYWTMGLWDTGATHSSISREAAEALNLEALGETAVISAQGNAIASIYMVSLNFPELMFLRKVRVTECASNDLFGVIIGMDIISLGDFAITNVDGLATFSFCVPGLETIDYVAKVATIGNS